ncbi:TIGR02452 family protein [Actinoplanes campanulatus]|uniref:TIGR02452 family protein n=1 Tax=Actinoplanes campanulatus TaxID=113559 RepID=UPI0019530D6C|nr:TIGR02452 family protein [Actinoplanes capillaceus]
MSARLRGIARETVAITERGWYDGPDGVVDIAGDVAAAVAGTRLHLPGDPLPEPAGVAGPPVIEVTAESTLAAARRVGAGVACLNFASARNPGGGFLNGAQAQEESIARGSAIYPALLAAGDFYAFHRADRGLLYTDRIIWSPGVPVFRDDRGRLLAHPYPVSILTSAAPNRAAITRNEPDLLTEVSGALARRAARVLRVAAAHGARELVLGAWGCGVFGNDPGEVARVFAAALRDGPWFDRVVFAIMDRRETVRDAFRAAFALPGDAGRRTVG